MAEQMTVSDGMLGALRATRPWVLFLAIVGFVFMGLMVLGMLAVLTGVGAAPTDAPRLFGPGMAFFELVMIALYFFPCLFLYRYAKFIGQIQSAGQPALENALWQQKSFWKFMGITMIVMLCFYLLFILIAVTIGLGVLVGSH